MPKLLSDSVLVPVPKSSKYSSVSSNYRPVALCSTLSKVLEHLILESYGDHLQCSHLQFGFKPGCSTTHCTGLVKSVVSQYLNRGSGCFLDAFDLVDHQILFQKLFDRGLPLPVLRFLTSWYKFQKCCVRWGSCFSAPFSVSNGVRQGSVLSPLLFAVYIDELLSDLSSCGVGCYCGDLFAGCVCYADDIVLLAPCQSALRTMLSICSNFATAHKLEFNTSKTQLICFRKTRHCSFPVLIHLNGHLLHPSDKVVHLGHILTYNLRDTDDILRSCKDLNRKANYILLTFKAVDPFVKSFLIKSFCLSLYGCCLWTLSSPDIHTLVVSLNHILRKVWCLPRNSHSAIGNCLARIPMVINSLLKRFFSFYNSAISSPSPLLKNMFYAASLSPNGHHHARFFTDEDYIATNIIREIRATFGCVSPVESIVSQV